MNDTMENPEPAAAPDSLSPNSAMEIVAERLAQILWDYVMWEHRMKREQANKAEEELGNLS